MTSGTWLDDLEVVWSDDLPPGVRGMTDGVRTVWLRPGLAAHEFRATLIHESFHISAGHDGCVSGPEEERIRWQTAQYLLPDPHPIIDALIDCHGNLHDAARELGVDRATLLVRLDRRRMHPAEPKVFHRRLSGAGVRVCL